MCLCAPANWGAQERLDYLDGKTKKGPEKIKDFSVQTQNIPSIKFVTNLLGTCNSIKAVLDSDEKYLPKRNRIAHKAEEFKSEKVYRNCRGAIDKAIKQLVTKLSQKINAIK